MQISDWGFDGMVSLESGIYWHSAIRLALPKTGTYLFTRENAHKIRITHNLPCPIVASHASVSTQNGTDARG